MYCTTVFPIFLNAKFHCKKTSNTWSDAEFNALQGYAVGKDRIDFRDLQESEKTFHFWIVTMYCTAGFPIFLNVKMHCKKTSKTWSDAQFNALQGHIARTERIYFRDLEKSEETFYFWNITMLCTTGVPIFLNVKVLCNNKSKTWSDAQFSALRRYIPRIERIDFENHEKSQEYSTSET